MQNQVDLTIYTDGACLNNPGPGGWAALIESTHDNIVLSGGCVDTTNNRMELIAVIKALERLNSPSSVQIYSDSKYVIDGATQYLPKWRANNWNRARSNKPVKNVELWQQLDSVMVNHTIVWRWVLAHSGVPQNEFVDTLARDEAIRIQFESV